MAAVCPIVRHFVACNEVVVSADGRHVTLHDLIHAILLLPGEAFPLRREKMALYALLSGGRGVHDFALELTRFDAGEEVLIYRSQPRSVDLGSDPMAVRGLPMPLRNVGFPQPGQYTFHLLCDGRRIAGEMVEVR